MIKVFKIITICKIGFIFLQQNYLLCSTCNITHTLNTLSLSLSLSHTHTHTHTHTHRHGNYSTPIWLDYFSCPTTSEVCLGACAICLEQETTRCTHYGDLTIQCST